MQKPLTPEQAQEAADAYINHGRNGLQAAQALGLPRSTFDNRLRLAKRLGMLPDELPGPGFEVKEQGVVYDSDGNVKQASTRTRLERTKKFKETEGFAIARKSTNVDGQGMVGQEWIIEKPDAENNRALVEAIREAVKGIKPRKPVKPPKCTDDSKLVAYQLADCHIGAFASSIRSGKGYTIEKARDFIVTQMSHMVAEAPSADTAILTLLGDTLHCDGIKNVTPGHGHFLSTDGTYSEALKAALEIVLELVGLILHKHSTCQIAVLAGNHDDSSSIGLRNSIYSRYFDSERVFIDIDAERVWTHVWGDNYFCAAHGDMVKLKDLPLLMADIDREAWGKTRHRYAYSGHRHYREITTIGSVTCHQLAPVTPGDSWGSDMGFTGQHGLSAFIFDKKQGQVGAIYRTFPSTEEESAVA